MESVLEEIVEKIPSPTGDENAPLKALIFDSYYDSYKGVIVYVRIKEGTVKPGDRIRMMATGAEFDVVEVGVMHPAGLVPNKGLAAGDVGYIAASIKNIQDTRVGAVSYTHLRAHETDSYLVCRLLLEKKKKTT